MVAATMAATRGKLTIFFGAAPGVGKTYAMLEAARFEREEGRDVAVGVVETRARYDTGALLLGLEILARRKLEHDDEKVEELDLDGALGRKPSLLVVDELAHTNARGSRHAKRWQDVDELLAAGIDVFTTLDVEHLESHVDVVAQIKGESNLETVPDVVFENADEVRVIDFTSGVVSEGDVLALRELSLRVAAERVDAQMRRYREAHGIERPWAVGERLLLCVSPSPASGPLIRAARRLAASLHAEWIAAYVETPASLSASKGERARVAEHLRLAQSLGAETVTLGGEEGPAEILRFARERNVTRVLVGKPTHARWRDRLKSPFLDLLVRGSGTIDIHVLSGALGESARDRARPPARTAEPSEAQRRATGGLLAGVGAVAVVTVVSQVFFGTALDDTVMLYMLAIVLVSMRWGLVPSIVTALLAVATFDFFFVPPYYTLAVTDLRHVVTFAVMLLVAAVISSLTKRVRDQAAAARERETRTASLYSLSRALAAAKTAEEVVAVGTKHVHDVFGARCTALVPSGDPNAPLDAVATPAPPPWSFVADEKDRDVGRWVFEHGKQAGRGTDTLPDAKAFFVPLDASAARVGVLGVAPSDASRIDTHDERRHFDAFTRQIATALERAQLATRAQEAQLRIETEQLRNSLLSSVSHDLRTPLAVITGTATTLLETELSANDRRELTSSIVSEADRLNRLVRNLLDMTRLEAGAVAPKKEWQSIEEAVGVALERTTAVLGGRVVSTKLPSDLPLVPYDPILLQQVLVNLLENAAKYTPDSSPIEIGAVYNHHESDERPARDVEIVVADRGPGLAADEATRIFDKFYRGGRGRGGVGLGLTICKGIVIAHGGRIWAENRDGGGAAFHFVLPIEGEPPAMDLEGRDERRLA